MSFNGWFWVLMLWVMFFWWYRDYRLDYFRQQLFALRDELFDLAREGELSFTDDVHRLTRGMLNGTIRFGHKLGFVDMVCLIASTRGVGRDKSRGGRFEGKIQNAYKGVSPDTRTRLESIRFRMLMLEQVVFTSSVLMLSFFALGFAIVSYLAGRWLAGVAHKMFLRPTLGQVLALNDYAACVYGGGIRSSSRHCDSGRHGFVSG